MPSIPEMILHMVERVEANEDRFGVLSTGEKIAVALVLDRRDLLQEVNGGYTILEAIDRLGETWTAAAIAAQKARS